MIVASARMHSPLSGKTWKKKNTTPSKLLTGVTGLVYNQFFLIMKRQEASFIVWGICWRGGLSLNHIPVLKRGLNSSSDLLNIQKDYFWNWCLNGERRISEVAASKPEFMKPYRSYKAVSHNKIKVSETVMRRFFCAWKNFLKGSTISWWTKGKGKNISHVDFILEEW